MEGITMRVKYLKGNSNRDDFVVIRKETEVRDLPDHIRTAILELGDLTIEKREDLDDREDKQAMEIRKALENDGAYFGKVNIRFKETEVSRPPTP